MKLLAGIFVAVVFAVLAINPSSGWADTQAGKAAFKNQDFKIALQEFTKSAAGNDAEAMFYLGRMHQGGFGVKKDVAAAVEWFRKAANLGHAESQTEFGTALALGDGVKQDVNEGLKWLFIAVQGGHEDARKYLVRLAKYFPRTVVGAARIAARKWRTDRNLPTEVELPPTGN